MALAAELLPLSEGVRPLSSSLVISGSNALVVSMLLAMAALAQAETGAEGWLRYAPLPAPAAQLYRTMPHHVVETSQSPIARNAANELTRGLHSMLGENLQLSATLPAEDAFIIGTPGEIRHLLPAWKAPSTIAPEGFSTSQFIAQGHTYWIIAGGAGRGGDGAVRAAGVGLASDVLDRWDSGAAGAGRRRLPQRDVEHRAGRARPAVVAPGSRRPAEGRARAGDV